jgi:hypothetical protein
MKQQQVASLLNDLSKDLSVVKGQLDRLELIIGEPEVAADPKRRARQEQDSAVDDLVEPLLEREEKNDRKSTTT